MRLLLDANVILDDALARPGLSAACTKIIGLCGTVHEGMIAWHTLATAYYIFHKEKKSVSQARQFASELLSWATVVSVHHKDAVKAHQMCLDDLEDAMQIVTAEACFAGVIITRNTKDFDTSTIPVFTPEDFLSKFHPAQAPPLLP